MENNSLTSNKKHAEIEASDKADTLADQTDSTQQNIPRKEDRGNVSSD
jgi:hypothetical protein